MKAFRIWQQKIAERMLVNWPQDAPPEVRHLTRAEAAQAFQAGPRMEPMPEAELTPEIAEARRLWRAAEKDSYEGFLNMGRVLLKIERQMGAENVRAWVAQYAPTIPWEDCLLGMRAAREEN